MLVSYHDKYRRVRCAVPNERAKLGAPAKIPKDKKEIELYLKGMKGDR